MTTLERLLVSSVDSLRPPERLNAWQAAEKYWHLSGIGSRKGRYCIDSTPYLREPMEVLDSLEYRAMCLVGPARTGKSAMAMGWICKTVMCDPTDMRVFNMTQDSAKDLSKGDIKRMFEREPALKNALRSNQDDNVHDKYFKNGMRLLIKWPSITELSGNTTQRIWLFDYDRGDGYKNVGGEGPAFPLARKRTQTYGRFGMVGVESSPGVDVEDPKFIPETPHQAPPIKTGIISIYNQGDRRRFYWECPQCHGAFEPDWPLFSYPQSEDPMESAEQVVLVCPHCGFWITQSMRDELNLGGTWVRDNMVWIPEEKKIVVLNGRKPIRSDIASFWMKSPPAFFASWKELVLRYIQAERHLNETGEEGPLKTVFNLDLGLPYVSRARVSDRVPEELKDRAENWGATEEVPTVPEDVRALIACVDVQARSFVVQVHGIAVGGDIVVIDGFKIRKSKTRFDKDGDPLPIEPGSYSEDWDQLIEDVIERSYPLGDGSGRKMSIMLTVSDSQGQTGVAPQALEFWRRLRKSEEGHHRRFALVKGTPNRQAPMVKFDYPGETVRKDRNSGARGDVPMLFLNSNKLKDQLSNLLGRTEPGGMIRWPDWIPDWFYTQLCAEVRSDDGKWENPRKRRNESWDLLCYFLAAVQKGRDSGPWPTLRMFEVDWESPPAWAKPWTRNDFVFDSTKRETAKFVGKKKRTSSLRSLGENLA